MARSKIKTRRVYIKAKRRYRKPKMTIPVAVIAGFAPLAVNGATWVRDMGWVDGLGTAASTLTGYNLSTGTWNAANLRFGTLPIIIGIVLHKIANKAGINRQLARTGLPIRL